MTDLVLAEKFPVVPYESPFTIVDEAVEFTSREEVQKHLPDICGRVLAKAWIDDWFYNMLKHDTLATFKLYGVTLPDNMVIEFEHKASSRASIVIYEVPRKNLKIRVCSLVLTMMARR